MSIQYYIILSFTLFSIGFIGILIRRNSIIVFMCIEMMLNAINLLMVAFSKMHYQTSLSIGTQNTSGSEAQIFVFFIMVLAAVEVAVGLSIIVMIYRNIHSIDINDLNRLKH